MTRVLELSDEELSVAVQLFDVAVKAGGLQVAGNAAVLAAKFQNAPMKADPKAIAQVPTVATTDVPAFADPAEVAPKPRRSRKVNGESDAAAL